MAFYPKWNGLDRREAPNNDRYRVMPGAYVEIAEGVRCVWPEPLVLDGALLLDGMLSLKSGDL